MIILDTNVLSETLKPAPSPDVVNWFVEQMDQLAITAVTQAEILYGLERLPAGKRRAQLATKIEEVLREFRGGAFSFDERAAGNYAAIAAARERIGRPISQTDAMIAAIARSHGATIATRDVKGFADCGVELINPWRAS